MEEGKYFRDRRDAGLRLGKLLEDSYKDNDTLVLGIPRGGIEIGYYIAKLLECEFSTIITKKLPFPTHKELAVGALSEDGTYYLTERGRSMDRQVVQEIIKEQKQEIEKRITIYRKGLKLPEIKGKTVIVVDDGIATGSTVVPALKLCRTHEAWRIVLASPVAGKKLIPEIEQYSDEIMILVQPEEFYAVGQVYEDFHNLSDFEVLEYLDDYSANKEMYRQTVSSARYQE